MFLFMMYAQRPPLHPFAEPLEPRFMSGLVPPVAETLQSHHVYLTVEGKDRVGMQINVN